MKKEKKEEGGEKKKKKKILPKPIGHPISSDVLIMFYYMLYWFVILDMRPLFFSDHSLDATTPIPPIHFSMQNAPYKTTVTRCHRPSISTTTLEMKVSMDMSDYLPLKGLSVCYADGQTIDVINNKNFNQFSVEKRVGRIPKCCFNDNLHSL